MANETTNFIATTTLRDLLSEEARTALSAGFGQGFDDPTSLHRWASAASADIRSSARKRAAARELADKLAQLALSGMDWRDIDYRACVAKAGVAVDAGGK